MSEILIIGLVAILVVIAMAGLLGRLVGLDDLPAVARSGVELMWVSPMRTSSHDPSAPFLTSAHTPTIAQSSARRVNFS